MYRGGAPVNPGPMNTLPSSFYSFEDVASRPGRGRSDLHTSPFSAQDHLNNNQIGMRGSHGLDAADKYMVENQVHT